ncbi:MAG: anaerobic ribonucleoside-triphosphate reductase activating protein [Nanoarchaeota archaeon]|nr:anaerobic ribonucleoside-triphosphate reductase activating protein [Nanoarchaeota archaeon]
MIIAGLQKTTLIDYPSKIACTIFLHGCNFRCGFCYNPDLVIRESKSSFFEEDILNFLKDRKGKLEAVCITGGEPLISLDLDFLKKIKELGYLIKIDTNGSFPEKLKEIIDGKLVDYIAMDIKGSPENYPKISGVNNVDKIEQSIKLIYEFGVYEFRTTAVKKFHDGKEIEKLGSWVVSVCNGKPKNYFLQGFKNKNDFIDEKFKSEPDAGENYLNGLKKIAEKYFEFVDVRV